MVEGHLDEGAGEVVADQGVDRREQVGIGLEESVDLLPAVNTLVGHHFTRTLVKVALDHVEREGSDEEREAVRDRIRTAGSGAVPDPRGTTVRSAR